MGAEAAMAGAGVIAIACAEEETCGGAGDAVAGKVGCGVLLFVTTGVGTGEPVPAENPTKLGFLKR